jgi:hypothetical protein
MNEKTTTPKTCDYNKGMLIALIVCGAVAVLAVIGFIYNSYVLSEFKNGIQSPSAEMERGGDRGLPAFGGQQPPTDAPSTPAQ